MELLGVLFIGIMIIGALVVGGLGLLVFSQCWWFIIPLLCALAAGPIGFIFGVGLVVVIGGIVLAIKG